MLSARRQTGKGAPPSKAGAHGPTVAPGLCGDTCDIVTMREVKPFQGVSLRMFNINSGGSISEHAFQLS